jgi:hypothetical protein
MTSLISLEWASGEKDAIAQWDFGTSDNIAYHRVWRQTQIPFDENSKPNGNGMANWGNVYWATNRVAGLTVQSGSDSEVRNAFINSGRLTGSADRNFRAIKDRWPVFGFAIDLGQVDTRPSNTLFTIGLLQKPAIQFLGTRGIEILPALWTSYFGSEELAVCTYFLRVGQLLLTIIM